ncbi:MAG: chorismate mutase [Leptolyngbya foveolarum]|uniref:Chromophore lyase CpcT/CpeT n=1 Tax=Leptolyngbya foveolarum TaxID=47253 RepID=A0A2W4UES7_9CYAN|nr:MAG: chorismate mutase [Leptolyngbya foveolarum]
MTTSPLKTLATYLVGEFENKAQAAADPSWYVHLRLWQRPIPSLSDSDTFTMLLEQASPVSDKPPYRQRVLQLTEQSGQIQGEYFALKNPLQFRGAGTQPALLNAITADDLVSLPNSTAHIQYQSVGAADYRFQSKLPEGKFCSFEYGKQRKYVYLGFDIEKKHSVLELKTYDKGINPDTGQGLWGALMGPFVLLKQDSYRWN